MKMMVGTFYQCGVTFNGIVLEAYLISENDPETLGRTVMQLIDDWSEGVSRDEEECYSFFLDKITFDEE